VLAFSVVGSCRLRFKFLLMVVVSCAACVGTPRFVRWLGWYWLGCSGKVNIGLIFGWGLGGKFRILQFFYLFFC
jgi:hypothetical protein